MIEEIRFNALKEFVEKLDVFNPELERWYFRGQANSDWRLMPSVWRRTNDALFGKFCEQMPPENLASLEKEIQAQLSKPKLQNLNSSYALQWVLRVKFENSLLSKFYYEANNIGLPVPALEHRRCEIYDQTFWYNGNLREIGDIFGYYGRFLQDKKPLRVAHLLFDGALPQHYGLPTRYMDWTINPGIAAFFAGYEYLKLNNKELDITEIAIYAIKDKLNAGPIQIKKHHLKHTNSFLRAQAGVFTLTHGDFYFLENGTWPSIEDLYDKHGNEYFELKKYMLNVEHVEHLMAGLKRQGISIASLMPSYTYVAELTRNGVFN